MQSASLASRPIGIFDSGVGGLTVYRALRALMPHENFVYLGDTARVPYGTKTPETVARYSKEIAARLLQENIKLLIVACNTATAHGLAALRAEWPELPCLGVIEPGAQAAAAASQNGKIVVLATEGTVRSGAYQAALKALRADAEVEAVGCNLLVSLAEEGWDGSPEAEVVIKRYLAALAGREYDTMVLGCTHFPLLAPQIRLHLAPQVALIDSAQTTAQAALTLLQAQNLMHPQTEAGETLFLVTDGLERFRSLMQRFGGCSSDSKVCITTLPNRGLA